MVLLLLLYWHTGRCFELKTLQRRIASIDESRNNFFALYSHSLNWNVSIDQVVVGACDYFFFPTSWIGPCYSTRIIRKDVATVVIRWIMKRVTPGNIADFKIEASRETREWISLPNVDDLANADSTRAINLQQVFRDRLVFYLFYFFFVGKRSADFFFQVSEAKLRNNFCNSQPGGSFPRP